MPSGTPLSPREAGSRDRSSPSIFYAHAFNCCMNAWLRVDARLPRMTQRPRALARVHFFIHFSLCWKSKVLHGPLPAAAQASRGGLLGGRCDSLGFERRHDSILCYLLSTFFPTTGPRPASPGPLRHPRNLLQIRCACRCRALPFASSCPIYETVTRCIFI